MSKLRRPRVVKQQSGNRSGKLAQQVSIIGGTHRSRVLQFPPETMVRPTLARIRETAFNWLMMEIHNARVLDLFAGSGVLGLESLSRGASQADFVELDAALCRALKGNIEKLSLTDAARVHHQDTHAWLAAQPKNEQYDVIWVDPPFDLFDADAVREMVMQVEPLLSIGGLCYLEQPKRRELKAFDLSQWQQLKYKVSAEVQYGLWRKVV